MNANTMSDLAEMCKGWKVEDEGSFAAIVGSYLKLTGVSQRVLADEFESSVSSVSRWASGEGKPPRGYQKLVVTWIGKAARKAAAATLPSAGYSPAPAMAAAGPRRN